jgi:hypothetical protein
MHFSDWESKMRRVFKTKLIAVHFVAVALTMLMAGPAAVAQTGSGGAGSSGAANQAGPTRDAPIGHRQPRPDQLRSEKNSSDPNDPLSKENAALDRKIKGICRGC